jgi:predicted secreted protein
MQRHDARRARRILDQLRDERSRRVVLVSHCLLNENTRYAGGATRPGAVTEVVEELVDAGDGIHQLPCPERLAWGGVLKPRTLAMYGSAGTPLHAVRRPLLIVFTWWTRLAYRRLARQVARDVVDYQRSGIAVTGFVGIGASPSCGVTTTLDLSASLDVVARCPLAALTRGVMNERAVLACRRPGQGLFVEALDHELRRRGASLPAREHDLAAELGGHTQAVLATPPTRTLGTRAG